MGNLSSLQELLIGGNEFTGCIPHELQGVYTNDLQQLPLPFCAYEPKEDVTGLFCPEEQQGVRESPEPNLLRDCRILLQARDTLAVHGSLNWRADIPIWAWRGLRVADNPSRVLGPEITGQQFGRKGSPGIG